MMLPTLTLLAEESRLPKTAYLHLYTICVSGVTPNRLTERLR